MATEGERSVAHMDESKVCFECGERHPFEMPKAILSAALEGKLVIFAGAGVSTESRLVLRQTLADNCRADLGDSAAGLDFPQLMAAYQKQFGRPRLLQAVRSRLDYIRSFPELQRQATRFHRELATMYFLTEVITTNWDTLFEDYSAATPIVIPADYAFWDLPGRKVIKLHGSMHNLGTIVATSDDYSRCYRQLRGGAIGASLRHILATKQIVFLGYSFGDSDLARLLRLVRRELGDILPRSYVVTPHSYRGTDFPADRVIRTDGTDFLRVLKQLAVDEGVMRADEVYDRIDALASRVSEARYRSAQKFRADRHPAVIYNWAYQDGMLDALGRIQVMRSSGKYSNPHATHGTLPAYEIALKGAIRKRDYFDAAYIEGYISGLLALEYADADQAMRLPVYFVWGSDLAEPTFPEFCDALRRAQELHKTATRKAERIMAETDGMVPVHTHTLDVPGLMAAAGYKGPPVGLSL